MLKSYLKEIHTIYGRGDAREESFYGALKRLLEVYTEKSEKKSIEVTVLPKKTEAGNPDFRIWDGNQHIVGYIEAKHPIIEDLDKVEAGEQLQRYISTFPNVMLTNFFEFRLYRNGDLVEKTQIARPFMLTQLGAVPPVQNELEFHALLDKFFSFSLPQVYDSQKLAVELAKRTRFLKEQVVIEELKNSQDIQNQIVGFYQAFKGYLISDLTIEDFSDLYSQTITYGLFAARTRSGAHFNRKSAFDNIPRTIGILRDIFRFISLGDLPQSMEWIVDDISEVLAVADVNEIFREYYREGKGDDPVIHFYETFLSEYDPKTRERRGVYYTPVPVVSYIVHSLHSILKEKFGLSDGLADKGVTVLDPAAGTLTFLAEAAKVAAIEYSEKYGEGGKGDFIKEHILNNFFALELMMAPYAIGHMKMSFLLEELGYRLTGNDRFKLYLTNALEMKELEDTTIPGIISLARESKLAGKVKKEQPILVILGNPPYSVSSMNKSDFIEKEMKLYKEDVRDERNIQPLSDDYIKFIRFAHWKIEKEGKGVIGMITNNSYLSGLIHRGMRKKLMDSFDDIYILNLHGSSRIEEKSPDENVFNIMQGVTISIFVKKEIKNTSCRLFYKDIYGLRKNKYNYLENNNIKTSEWKELKPFQPNYFFADKELMLNTNYKFFFSVKEIFIKYNVGTVTGKDKILVDFSRESLLRKLSVKDKDVFYLFMRSHSVKDDMIDKWYSELKDKDIRNLIYIYSYRPFDHRFFIYNSKIIERLRPTLMKHFFRSNLAVVLQKNTKTESFSESFISQHVSDYHLIGHQSYIFPLYVYSYNDNNSIFNNTKPVIKTPNISLQFVETLKKCYSKELSPEKILYYIYATLYSNIYRTKYTEFLKIDFPRIPFTKDYPLFTKMAELGERLVNLHLLKSVEIDTPIAKFQGKGNNIIKFVKYENGRVRINNTQYFEGITPEIWEYQIGGYQVIKKWLNYRKGRALDLEDIKHICRVATALLKTIEIQEEIDIIYPEVENSLIEFI
ncbi:MAG: N-6 DNA methylase [candidate division Zixibacteria bacterium]|nr:N-6 DNA methylase [Candidatus Tariuqbacter arcticus]